MHKIICLPEHKTISLSEIDLEDKRYRITKKVDSKSLTASIKLTGLLNPPRVRQMGNHYIVVTGFKRVASIKALAMETIPVLVIPEKEDTHALCCSMAVCENAFQRPLDTMEQARAVFILGQVMTVKEIAANALSLFNMEMNPRLVQKLIDLGTMSREVHDLVEDSRLSMTSALRLKSFDPVTQSLFVGLFKMVKLNLNKQMEVMTNIIESAARDGKTPKEVLESNLVKDILADEALDSSRKGKTLRSVLNQLRYPAISKAMETFDKTLKQLDLGSSICLAPPVNFEARDYNFSFKFATMDELRQRVRVLNDLSVNPVMEQIVK